MANPLDAIYSKHVGSAGPAPTPTAGPANAGADPLADLYNKHAAPTAAPTASTTPAAPVPPVPSASDSEPDDSDTPTSMGISAGANAALPTPGFVSNIGSNAGQIASGLGHAIMHPINTAATLGKVGMGALERGTHKAGDLVTPGLGDLLTSQTSNPSNTQAFDAYAGQLKSEYGSWDAVKKHAYEHPLSFLLDLSSVVGGAGSLADTLGLARTASTLGKASEILDPVGMSTKIVGSTANALGRNVAAPIAGKLTATSGEVIRTAAGAGPGVAEGLRGGITHEHIANGVMDAAKALVDKRRDEYRAQLAQIPQNTTLPIGSVTQELSSQLRQMGVKVRYANGRYSADFTGPYNTTISSAEKAAIQDALDDVQDTARRGDPNVLAMDALKQRLSQRIGNGPRADKVVTATRDVADNLLDKHVPGYSNMTEAYARASDTLAKLNHEFALRGGNIKVGTTVKRLEGVFNKQDSVRLDLIDMLDNEFGTQFRNQLSGAELHAGIAKGLMGKAAATHAVMHPGIASAMHVAMVSPRITGEALLALAKARQLKQMIPAVPAAATDIALRSAQADQASPQGAHGIPPPPSQ